MKKITANLYELEELGYVDSSLFNDFQATSWEGIALDKEYLYQKLKAEYGRFNICYDIPTLWATNFKIDMRVLLPLLNKRLDLIKYDYNEALASRKRTLSREGANSSTSNGESNTETSSSSNALTTGVNKSYDKAPVIATTDEDYLNNESKSTGTGETTGEATSGTTNSNTIEGTNEETITEEYQDASLMDIKLLVADRVRDEISAFIKSLDRYFLLIY